MIVQTQNLDETKKLAGGILNTLSPRVGEATILALYGDLGAGKTSFTQGLALALGVTETITSPTFVIEKIYDLPPDQLFQHLIHIDAYRLNNGTDLLKLGWGEIMSDPGNLIIIEWPDRVAEILPASVIPIHFVFIDEETRNIKYDG